MGFFNLFELKNYTIPHGLCFVDTYDTTTCIEKKNWRKKGTHWANSTRWRVSLPFLTPSNRLRHCAHAFQLFNHLMYNYDLGRSCHVCHPNRQKISSKIWIPAKYTMHFIGWHYSEKLNFIFFVMSMSS